ncbi:hypothetical protein ACNKHR_12560 [Shigella flexneri]
MIVKFGHHFEEDRIPGGNRVSRVAGCSRYAAAFDLILLARDITFGSTWISTRPPPVRLSTQGQTASAWLIFHKSFPDDGEIFTTGFTGKRRSQ